MVKNMFKKVGGVLLFGLLVSACNAGSGTQFNSVAVIESGYEGDSEWCSDFNLTSEEAGDFLEKTKELTVNQYHNEYEHLSCYVKGTTRYKETSCQFTVWAGATAELTCDDGQEFLLGCSSCELIGKDQ